MSDRPKVFRYVLFALSIALISMAVTMDACGYNASRVAIAASGLLGIDCTLWMRECIILKEKLKSAKEYILGLIRGGDVS